jgi:hypothetical protein
MGAGERAASSTGAGAAATALGYGPKSAKRRGEVQDGINAIFESNCDSNLHCAQSAVYEDLNIYAGPGCTIKLGNVCTTAATCEHVPFDKVAEWVQSSASAALRHAVAAKLELDDDVDMAMKVAQRLTMSCDMNSSSYQALRVRGGEGGNVRCYANSTIEMRNRANHYANCTTNLLDESLDDLSYEDAMRLDPEFARAVWGIIACFAIVAVAVVVFVARRVNGSGRRPRARSRRSPPGHERVQNRANNVSAA